MKINIPEKLINHELQIQSLLIKATNNLNQKDYSEFRFVQEYIDGVIKYVEETMKAIAVGLALKLNVDPTLVQKSIKIPIDTLIKAANGEEIQDELFYKSLFSALKEKFTVAKDFFKKFKFNKGKPLEPMKFKGRLIYNPETDAPLTEQEWTQITRDIQDFLGDKIGTLEESMIVRAGLFGKLLQASEEEGKTLSEIKNMSYDEVEEDYGAIPDTVNDAVKNFNLSSPEAASIEWAQSHAAEHLSIKDGSLKNKIVNMVRKQITGGLEDGVSAQEMASRLYWIDPTDELGQRFTQDTINAINRDFRRICFPTGTKVTTLIGNQKIENLKVGRKVVTHTGEVKKVKEFIKQKYTGRIIRIKTKSGQILEATEDHPIYVYRNNKYQWIAIKNLKLGDKLLKVEMTGAFANKKHTRKYKKDMRKSAIKNKNYLKNIYDEKTGERKSDITMKEMYKNGELEVWNKNKTKENDKSVAKLAKSIQSGFDNGREVWNKGETKETNKSVASCAKKTKGRIRSEEQRANWRKSFCSNPDNKEFLYSKGIKGYVVNISSKEKEFYRSSFEKKFMEYCNKMEYNWTSKHKIFIKYVDIASKKRGYIPDFLVIKDNKKYLIEIKASWQIKVNYKSTLEKFKAAKVYCKQNNLIFKVLTEKWLNQKELL